MSTLVRAAPVSRRLDEPVAVSQRFGGLLLPNSIELRHALVSQRLGFNVALRQTSSAKGINQRETRGAVIPQYPVRVEATLIHGCKDGYTTVDAVLRQRTCAHAIIVCPCSVGSFPAAHIATDFGQTADYNSAVPGVGHRSDWTPAQDPRTAQTQEHLHRLPSPVSAL